MEGGEKIIVIIPVYKAEQYIQKCLMSVCEQTYTELEIIIIDDGSPDNCGAICDEFAKSDSRIKVIHTPNRGAASARNTGLKEASGTYIGFVDSDDNIDRDMYERLLCKLLETDSDMVYCEATYVHSDGTEFSDSISLLDSDCVLEKNMWYPDLLKEMAGGVHHALYTRKLIDAIGGRFQEELKFSEDRVFNILAMGTAKKVYFYKQAPYHININESSITRSFYPNYFDIANAAKKATEDALVEVWDNDKAYKLVYLDQYLETYQSGLYRMVESKQSDRWCSVVSAIKSACENTVFRESLKQQKIENDYSHLIINRKYLQVYWYISSKKYRVFYAYCRRIRQLGVLGTIKKICKLLINNSRPR